MSKLKIPLTLKLICRMCIFNGNHFRNPLLVCAAHSGLFPVVWSKFLFITTCSDAKFGKKRKEVNP